MPLTPENTRIVAAFADRLAHAPQGERGDLVKAQAVRLGVSAATLYGWLKQVGWRSGRRRRADAGTSSVPRDEAFHASNLLRQTQRATGKQLMCTESVVEVLRHNGQARFERADRATGELVPVSAATVRRAMRLHGVAPAQIRRATPHVALKSLHPNHVWQIDASVCVLYYLDHGGLAVADADEFYKNKPEAVQKRFKQQVIRYLATDHYSGAFFLEYYEGAESAQLLTDFFIAAVSRRADNDLLRGVPFILQMDPGSANKSHLFVSLAKRLDIEVMIHRTKNPRAKGSVEKHHDLVERDFEGRLPFHRVSTLEALRAYKETWSAAWQATRRHTRHGHTRYGLWQTIRAEQLREAPPAALMYELLATGTKAVPVRGDLTVRYAVRGYGTRSYDVRHVPGILVGEKLTVAVNPYKLPAIFVLTHDAEGQEVRYACEPIGTDAAGFLDTAQTIGQGLRTAPDTAADTARKQMDIAAYGGTTQAEADRLRKERAPAYGGEVDAFGYLADLPRPSFMQRAGTPIDVRAPVVEAAPLAPPAMVDWLLANGVDLPDLYDRVKAMHPEGAPEADMPGVAARLRRLHDTPDLREVSNG